MSPSTLSLPEEGIAEPVKTLFQQSEHFRQFVTRQQENRREYEYYDKDGKHAIEAVDPNQELTSLLQVQQQKKTDVVENNDSSSSSSPTALPKIPTIFKVAGKPNHLLIRAPHPRWFDLALQDFLKRKTKLESGQSRVLSTSSVVMIGVLFLVLIFFCWPLWGFFVEIQANEHYRALGVEPGAPLNEVTKAYREAVRRLHPDKNPGCGQVCVTEMMKVKKAYEVLKGKDEASELQQQIDGMMAQIVMFMFGDVLVFTIQTGFVLSGIMRFYIFGSLDYEVNLDRPQPPSFLKTAVSYVDLLIRGLLVVCGLGMVLFTSDRNPVSLIAIVYAVVTQMAGNRDSVEDLYRYRGLQVWDMLTSVFYFAVPALLSHLLLPKLVLFGGDSLESLLASYCPFLEDFFSDVNQSHFGWSVLVSLIGVSHILSAVYTAPPSFSDNKTMMRCMLPIDVSAVVAERADTSQQANSDGTSTEIIQTRKATTKSVFWFVLTTICKRDILAFGLRIPAPYRLAALAVYGATFYEMTQLPNESCIFFDTRFRKAEDAAKRRIELLTNSSNNNNINSPLQRKSNDDQSSSASANSNNNTSPDFNTATSSFLPPPALGQFDFASNDFDIAATSPTNSPNYRPLQAQTFRMNDGERDVITQLDLEVPAWIDLMRLDDYLLVPGQAIADTKKLENVLKEIAKRDLKLNIERNHVQGQTRFTPIFESLEQQQRLGSGNNNDSTTPYGAYRTSLVSRLMSHSAEKFWDSEFSVETNSLIGTCVFWIVAAIFVFILHVGGGASNNNHQHLRIRASKIFLPEEAFAKVYDLNIQQSAGFTVNNCDEDPEEEPIFLNNNKLQRSRNTKATLCRTLVVPDQTSRQATTLSANMLFNTEGYDPRVVIYAEDIMSEEEEFKLRSQVMTAAGTLGEDDGEDVTESASILRKKKQHQQQRVSEKQKQSRSQHSLSLRKRKEDEKAAAKRRRENGEEESGGGFFGSDVPFFADNTNPDRFGGHDPSNPSEADMEDFMKFAQELERRQRSRGWRPKPQFRGKGTPKRSNNPELEKNGGKKNKNLRLGAGNTKRDNTMSEEGYGKFNVDGEEEEDNGDGAHLLYDSRGSDLEQQQHQSRAQVINIKNVQMKLMQKMSRWIETEVNAGRLHLNSKGQVIEQDRSMLVEWMLENDETWEPDPDFGKKKNDRLGGPAAEELRKLRNANNNNNRGKGNNKK